MVIVKILAKRGLLDFDDILKEDNFPRTIRAITELKTCAYQLAVDDDKRFMDGNTKKNSRAVATVSWRVSSDLRFLLTFGLELATSNLLRTMAEMGCFVSMARSYADLIKFNAGVSVKFPANVSFGSSFVNMDGDHRPVPQAQALNGARIFGAVEHRTRRCRKSSDGTLFLEQLRSFVGGAITACYALMDDLFTPQRMEDHVQNIEDNEKFKDN